MAESRCLARQHRFLDHAKMQRWPDVEAMLVEDPELVNVHPNGRWSALHQASKYGNANLVERLLVLRADVNMRTSDGQTPAAVAFNTTIRHIIDRANTRRRSKSPRGRQASPGSHQGETPPRKSSASVLPRPTSVSGGTPTAGRSKTASKSPRSSSRRAHSANRSLEARFNVDTVDLDLPNDPINASSGPRVSKGDDQAEGHDRDEVVEGNVHGSKGKSTKAKFKQQPEEEAGAVREDGRQDILARLREVPFQSHSDPLFMHGRGYIGPMKKPKTSWECKDPPRDDHDCPNWLTATEYVDVADVMRQKIKALANLMLLSQKTVLYTGAGISAAVVGQAARSGENTVGFKANPMSARPTKTHYALALLGMRGLVHGWVQQNHDGLPQKAGFPQERINEIHGSWFDPSNPVVKYSGSLHGRSYPWMLDDAQTADLVLVLGTSLGGLNADQVAINAADRSFLSDSKAALGTVCINLQQTPQDGKMTLRIFGQSDMVLRALLFELGLGAIPTRPPTWPRESKALVPYDGDGRRLPPGETRWMWLDLTDRAKVQITPGHNIQGARQPQYMHIGATRTVTFGGTKRDPAVGYGTVLRREEFSFLLVIERESFHLGVWWLVAAMRGLVEALPVVNQFPAYAAND